MNKPLKIRKIGNSAGVILPRAVMERMRVELGDDLYLTEAPDGSYRLTPSNPEFDRQMAVARAVMRKDRDVLRILAQ